MLNFWYRTLRANDTASLEALATEVVSYYRARGRTEYTEGGSAYGGASDCASRELTAFMSALWQVGSNPVNYVDIFFVSLTTPFSAQYLKGSPIKLRYAFSALLPLVPIGEILRAFLREIDVPKQYRYSAQVWSLALAEVALTELTHGRRRINPTRLALTTTYVAYVLALSTPLLKALDRFGMPRAVTNVVAYGIGTVAAPVMQRLARYGLGGTVKWLVEKAAAFMFRAFEKKLPELPIDAVTPPDLECSICHELLRDPVEVCGTFFCRECLKQWMRVNSVHPLTNVNISADMVSESLVMSHIAYKYHALYLRNL